MIRAILLCACVLTLSGCVSASATYDPATRQVTLHYQRVGDIEMEAEAKHAGGETTVTIRSVSQAAALNTAVSALAAMAKSPNP